MKRLNFKAFSVTSLAILGVVGGVSSSLMVPQTSQANAVEQQVAQAATSPTALRSGSFVGTRQHPTQGIARIVTQNGKRFLVFNQNFKTDSGPALYVLLHKSGKPTNYNRQNYVNLGRLKKTKGTQRYAIPDGVNLQDFRSAVVWCKRFNVTFGYATLNRS